MVGLYQHRLLLLQVFLHQHNFSLGSVDLLQPHLIALLQGNYFLHLVFLDEQVELQQLDIASGCHIVVLTLLLPELATQLFGIEVYLADHLADLTTHFNIFQVVERYLFQCLLWPLKESIDSAAVEEGRELSDSVPEVFSCR